MLLGTVVRYTNDIIRLEYSYYRGVARGGGRGAVTPPFLNENFKLRNYKLIFDKNVVLQLT